MNNNVRQRIEALEQRFRVDPLSLTMPDGSVRVIPGGTRDWQKLNSAAFAADGACQPPELEWLKSAVQLEGNNREVFNLTKILLEGGVDCEDASDQITED